MIFYHDTFLEGGSDYDPSFETYLLEILLENKKDYLVPDPSLFSFWASGEQAEPLSLALSFFLGELPKLHRLGPQKIQ